MKIDQFLSDNCYYSILLINNEPDIANAAALINSSSSFDVHKLFILTILSQL